MRVVVLVKQVPDLRLGGIGVRPDGTIDRGAATPITNPADLHAVEAAVQVATLPGDEIVALSMGPAQAEATLRDAVTGGAQRAVLLCDHLLAGSDTWATANALAAAVRWLGGADLVVCGLSALDGETGQVGPSVAHRLGWPQVTGCESLSIDDGALEARRIVEGGFEVVRAALPAVVTVGETGFAPRYPSVAARRRGHGVTVEVVDAATVGLDADHVGLAASPTKVARMTPAPWPERGCRFVGDDFPLDDLVAELARRRAFAGHPATATPAAADDTDPPPPDGPVHDGPAALWVVCHGVDGRLDRASRELLSEAVDLAPPLGGGVGALVIGGAPGRLADDAALHGADVVMLAAHEALEVYRTEPYARVVADAVRAHRPQAVLLAATTTGRDLAPRVASMLDTGLAADCMGLYVDSWTRQGVTHDRLLHMVRPAMAGGVLATCLCPTARPQMATVRPGAFRTRLAPRTVRLERLPFQPLPEDDRVQIVGRHISAADVDLRDAAVVIAGGAGCDAAGWPLVEALAAAVGGSVAASRGAVEAGLATRSQQVGQTGATIRPTLYVACGISGALQHAVGMQDSTTIVAINRDRDAPVFRLAHFGIVGDVHDVLPALTAAIRSAPLDV